MDDVNRRWRDRDHFGLPMPAHWMIALMYRFPVIPDCQVEPTTLFDLAYTASRLDPRCCAERQHLPRHCSIHPPDPEWHTDPLE